MSEFSLFNSKLKLIGGCFGNVDCNTTDIEKTKGLFCCATKISLIECLEIVIKRYKENATLWESLKRMKQFLICACNNVMEIH
jgi:hypothetical protein